MMFINLEDDDNEAQDNGDESGDDDAVIGGDDENDEDEGGSNKLILIIGGVVALLVVVGAGLYFTGMLDSLLGKEKSACVEVEDAEGHMVEQCPEEGAEGEHGEHGEDKAVDKGPVGPGNAFLEIPAMVVNLNTQDGTPRYLRLTVQLELYNDADLPKVEAVLPRVIDQFQTYLRELRVKDLRGSAGIYRLQTELLWRVNQAADPVHVKDVLFQEILIQ